VILVDTNILVSVANDLDNNHAVTLELLETVPDDLVVTATMTAEVCSLLHQRTSSTKSRSSASACRAALSSGPTAAAASPVDATPTQHIDKDATDPGPAKSKARPLPAVSATTNSRRCQHWFEHARRVRQLVAELEALCVRTAEEPRVGLPTHYRITSAISRTAPANPSSTHPITPISYIEDTPKPTRDKCRSGSYPRSRTWCHFRRDVLTGDAGCPACRLVCASPTPSTLAATLTLTRRGGVQGRRSQRVAPGRTLGCPHAQ
jgi:predicted nucleic acid-binding protein